MRHVTNTLMVVFVAWCAAVTAQHVGINSQAPEGTLHIKGASSIPFPNLRLTDTSDNFARIKMETTIGGDRFWDIAASTTPLQTALNFYYKNDTLGENVLQIIPDLGRLVHRSLTPSVRTLYYANQNEYQGIVGFIGEHLHLQSVRDQGMIRMGTRSNINMVLDTIGRLGLGTDTPGFLADFRGSDDNLSGGELQLSTPSQTNFLRFFGGRLGDPHPFIAFHESDTFHLVTTSADWSTYQRRMTMLPNGFLGLGTDKPSVELDIMSGGADDGVELHLSNLDTTHFLRLYSGRQGLPHPIIYWHHGNALDFGMANPDESAYQQFVSLDGKTIGVHNTGGSVFVGEEAGEMDDGTTNYSTAIGTGAMKSNETGFGNTAVGAFGLHEHKSGNYNVAVGRGSMHFDTTGHNSTAIGAGAMEFTRSGGWNTAVGVIALQTNKAGLGNVAVGALAMAEDTVGDWNTALGGEALSYLRNGSQNTAVGYHAGGSFTSTTFSGCVMLGYYAGAGQEEDNRLFISNSGGTPLIYGEFDNDLLRVNGVHEVTGDLKVGDAFIVDESLQRLGIGTQLPIVELHVADTDGISYITNESGAGLDAIIQLTDDASQGADHQWTLRRDGSDGGKLQWRHSNFHKMTLTPGGKLGIGGSAANPDYPLDVNGTINANKDITTGVAMRVNGQEALWSDGTRFSWGFGDNNITHNQFERPISVGTGSGSVPGYTLEVKGTAGKPGGGSWVNSSDRRLKQNVQPFADGLAEVMQIDPVTYQYNEASGYETEPEHVGVIAQELQEVAPYMVSSGKDGYLNVDNSAMTYMLVNAVQELSAQNQELRSVISELTNKVHAQDLALQSLTLKIDTQEATEVPARIEENEDH